ncbi:MAG: metallophosphoesterase [Epulopiscium sp.]|nr:metallophosphoesterase [Candidatus Epulonipiscium sp.]
MKFLIISDTHGDLYYAIQLIEKLQQQIKGVIHLGDHDEDAKKLQRQFSTLSFAYVAGNCDFSTETPREKILTIGTNKVWLLHGHRHHVKWGYDFICNEAQIKGVQGVLFGHTHIPAITYEKDILFMNPGSISRPRQEKGPSYGLLELDEKGQLHPHIGYIKNKNL